MIIQTSHFVFACTQTFARIVFASVIAVSGLAYVIYRRTRQPEIEDTGMADSIEGAFGVRFEDKNAMGT